VVHSAKAPRAISEDEWQRAISTPNKATRQAATAL
jgi:hypothetical protein